MFHMFGLLLLFKQRFETTDSSTFDLLWSSRGSGEHMYNGSVDCFSTNAAVADVLCIPLSSTGQTVFLQCMFIQSFQFDLLFLLVPFHFWMSPPFPKICHVSPLFLFFPFLSIVSTSGLHRMIAPNFSGERRKILIQFKKNWRQCQLLNWSLGAHLFEWQLPKRRRRRRRALGAIVFWMCVCDCRTIAAVQHHYQLMYTLTVVPFWYPFDSLVLHFPFCTFFPFLFHCVFALTQFVL